MGEDGVSLRPRRRDWWNADGGVPPDHTYRCGVPGELDATLTVHDERFFLRALTGSDIGLGESFMDGDWTGAEMVPLVRLSLRNRRRARGTEPIHRRAAPTGGRRRAPPTGTIPSLGATGTSISITISATISSASFSTPIC